MNNRGEFLIFILMLVLILAMGVGYTSDVKFKNSGIKYGPANIYYDNIQVSDNVQLNNMSGMNLDYSVNLKKPGDFYEIYVDVVNGSDVNVEVAEIFCNNDNRYFDYDITYDDGTQIKKGDLLEKGEVKTIKYRVSYKKYVDTDTDYDMSFSINYEQAL